MFFVELMHMKHVLWGKNPTTQHSWKS